MLGQRASQIESVDDFQTLGYDQSFTEAPNSNMFVSFASHFSLGTWTNIESADVRRIEEPRQAMVEG